MAIGDKMVESDLNGIEWLSLLTRDELLAIPGVGSKVAGSIVSFFEQEENRGIIIRLKKAGVRLGER